MAKSTDPNLRTGVRDVPRTDISVTLSDVEVEGMDSLIDAQAQATGTTVTRNDWLRNVIRAQCGLPLLPLEEKKHD